MRTFKVKCAHVLIRMNARLKWNVRMPEKYAFLWVKNVEWCF